MEILLVERLVGPLLTRWPAAETLILLTAAPLLVLEALARRVMARGAVADDADRHHESEEAVGG